MPDGVCPHVWYPPEEIEMNVPDGVLETWLKLSSPQHCTFPDELMPHVKDFPADTVENVPDGGLACPLPSLPQHDKVPESVMPQL